MLANWDWASFIIGVLVGLGVLVLVVITTD